MRWRQLSLPDPTSSSSSLLPVKLCHLAVDYLNSLTASVRDKCAQLRLQRVHQVAVMETPEEMRKFHKSKDADGLVPDFSDDASKQQLAVYALKLETAPNGGLYEISVKLKEGKWEFDERTISRTNRYGDQPRCVADTLPHLRKYCYCG